jgi:hypothetical protein
VHCNLFHSTIFSSKNSINSKKNIKLSPERIAFELERVQASILYDISNAVRFRMPSNMSNDAKTIYKRLGIDRDLSIQKY